MAGKITRAAVTGACRAFYPWRMETGGVRMRSVGWIKGLLLACVLVGAPAGPARAQQAPADAPPPATEWSPRTGDAWVDATLADLNAYGRRYPDAFADELARYHGAPRDVVEALLADPGWMPGDVYFACALAQAVGRSCRYVADARQADPAEGWGALAQRLGAAAGSPGFGRLKDGFADAYARWGRPLPPPAGRSR
jgi:hypothetical protein